MLNVCPSFLGRCFNITCQCVQWQLGKQTTAANMHATLCGTWSRIHKLSLLFMSGDAKIKLKETICVLALWFRIKNKIKHHCQCSGLMK